MLRLLKAASVVTLLMRFVALTRLIMLTMFGSVTGEGADESASAEIDVDASRPGARRRRART